MESSAFGFPEDFIDLLRADEENDDSFFAHEKERAAHAVRRKREAKNRIKVRGGKVSIDVVRENLTEAEIEELKSQHPSAYDEFKENGFVIDSILVRQKMSRTKQEELKRKYPQVYSELLEKGFFVTPHMDTQYYHERTVYGIQSRGNLGRAGRRKAHRGLTAMLAELESEKLARDYESSRVYYEIEDAYFQKQMVEAEEAEMEMKLDLMIPPIWWRLHKAVVLHLMKECGMHVDEFSIDRWDLAKLLDEMAWLPYDQNQAVMREGLAKAITKLLDEEPWL